MIGDTRRHFSTLDSTNTYALNWLDAPDGALVVADAQSAGRGRLGRSWSSPPGVGLYFSLLLRELAPETKGRLSLLVGLAVADAVRAVSGAHVQLKWPNDILLNARKIGGILCEATTDRVVAGVGLNVAHSREQLPERPIFPASSLLLETGHLFERPPLLQAMVEHLHVELDSAEWKDQRVRLDACLFGRGELARARRALGLVEGVGEEGALLLRTSEGIVAVRSGEVEFF